MQIRSARPEEAPLVMALHRRTVRLVNGADYTDQQVDRWLARQDPDRVRRRCLDGDLLVAAGADAGLLGFATVVGDELKALYVGADHQRRGVGTALLAAAEAKVRAGGHGKVRSVITLTARPFYAARGYVELRELRWPADDLYGLEAWEVERAL